MSERLSTGCRGLDEQLKGGIETGASTLAYGEPGSGKTSLAIQLSKKVISSGRKSIFIDTEGVSSERIKQIFGDTNVSDLIILKPENQGELHQSVTDIRLTQPDVGIIIVDTINAHTRLAYSVDREACEAQFLKILMTLQNISRTHHTSVFMTAQILERNGEIEPYFGRTLVYMAKTLLLLEKGEVPSLRHSRLVKHRSITEGSVIDFLLTNQGLE